MSDKLITTVHANYLDVDQDSNLVVTRTNFFTVFAGRRIIVQHSINRLTQNITQPGANGGDSWPRYRRSALKRHRFVCVIFRGFSLEEAERNADLLAVG